jgi:hypothetical protein
VLANSHAHEKANVSNSESVKPSSPNATHMWKIRVASSIRKWLKK